MYEVSEPYSVFILRQGKWRSNPLGPLELTIKIEFPLPEGETELASERSYIFIHVFISLNSFF
jgi:hypothetical protein